MEDIITKLIEVVEKASPALWEIARRQVVVEIIYNGIGLVIFGAVTVVAARMALLFSKKHQEDKDEDYEWIVSLAFGVCILSIILLTILTGEIIARLVNPDYYAIKILLELVP